MGRSPCCTKEEMKRGAWTSTEDQILSDHIKAHGEGKWRKISKETGLKRCGKSCRLRWLNYLRPDIKRGNITDDEEDLIIRLHKLLGNRWSLIAGRLPGRTDNEIKNYWNTYLSKKAQGNQQKPPQVQNTEVDHGTEDVFVEKLNVGAKVEGDQINIAGNFEHSDELPALMWSKDESFTELMADFNSGEMVFPEFTGFDFSYFVHDFGVDQNILSGGSLLREAR